ncbi:MAG: GNAT family N-acetyltransferase, partial [Pseudomonadota bacterium]
MDGLILRTPRLQLRPPRPSDVEAISRLSSAWEIARMTTRIPHPNPPESVRAFFASLGEARELALVIDDGEPAGFIGHGQELGYWLGRPFWGRGYATEAAEAMLAHVFGALGREAAQARVFADNPASMRVLTKLGFRETGVESGPSVARGGAVALVGLGVDDEVGGSGLVFEGDE